MTNKPEINCEEIYTLSVFIDGNLNSPDIFQTIDVSGQDITQKDGRYCVDAYRLDVYADKSSSELIKYCLVDGHEFDSFLIDDDETRSMKDLFIEPRERFAYTQKDLHTYIERGDGSYREAPIDVDVTVHVYRAYEPDALTD